MVESQSKGIGFFSLLTILLIGLKLCKVIDWSWIWIFSPLWGGIAIFLIILLSVFTFSLFFGILRSLWRKL